MRPHANRAAPSCRSFDSAGLLTAIAQDADSGEVLMVAFMDREALDADARDRPRALPFAQPRAAVDEGRELGPRARGRGDPASTATRTRCVLKVRPGGPACHTGARSCFYRALEGDGLTRLDG